MIPACTIALGLFPRLLGVVYLLAFGSLLLQVRGLYGSRGILPMADYAAAVRDQLGRRGLWRFPSIFLWRAGDPWLVGGATLGVLLALLLAAGVAPLPLLLVLWLIYLSFVSLGQEFLSYQWDALLLETGLLTMVLALAPPSALACWAYRLFVFRFMFSAGAVKLTSGDPSWRTLRALMFHYETQPIPNRPAWYAHQLPEPMQRLSCLGTFFFELAVPFMALGPAPARLFCFGLLVLFQGLIMVTGNYGFFNILTMVLTLPLLDDRYLAFLAPVVAGAAPASGSPLVAGLASCLFLVAFLLNGLQLVWLFSRPPWLARLFSLLAPWYVSSPYGLFAVMTTSRFEFVIEGSNDLSSWQSYEFRWKPGDPAVAPGQAAPHQPRLDWQMWFAALNPRYVEPWLLSLVRRLLEGSPPVLALFRRVPFPEAPPAHIRLAVYRYHFRDRSGRRNTGQWWERTAIGASPPLSLQGGVLRQLDPEHPW